MVARRNSSALPTDGLAAAQQAAVAAVAVVAVLMGQGQARNSTVDRTIMRAAVVDTTTSLRPNSELAGSWTEL